MNESEVRAYLLGQVSEEEAARLEARLLDDEELFGVAESVEDDLFDAHARGRLDPADKARFEARYGADGERQRFARAFSKRVDGGSTVVTFQPKSAWRRWAPLAAAAAVVIVTGGVLVERGVTPAPPIARVPQPAPTFAPPDATFALAIASSRAVSDATILSVPRDAAVLQLRVRLNPADRFDQYAMDLRSSAADARVWSGADLHAIIDSGDLVVVARVPASAAPDGSYELTVRGVRPGGEEDLGFVALKVVRVP